MLPLGDPRGGDTTHGGTAARDRALDQLEAARADLVPAARAIAVELGAGGASVTSPQVLVELRKRGWGAELDAVDLRFMGAVFRAGWERVGWVTGKASPGSHARPVAVWRRK